MESMPELPSAGIRIVLAAAFATIALFIYGPSLGNAFVQWDDGLLIYDNPTIMEISPSSIHHAFTTYDPELYIPLTLLSYQADWLVGGGSPFPFHAQNLFLHTLNALFVCWLAFLFLKNRTAAAIVGLLFLVHPLHTEAVAWASARKDVLSTFFFLSSLISFLYADDRESSKLYWLSVALFACALLSKVMVMTLPVLLLLLAYRERGRIRLQDVLQAVPFIVLSIIFGIVALFGKTDVNAASSFADKMLMAVKSAVFYVQKLILPTDLTVVYPFPDAITLSSPAFYVPAIILAGLLVFVGVSLRYTRTIAVWFAFYFVALAPTFINISKGDNDIYSASDRYAYLPSIGIFLLLGTALTYVLSHAETMRELRTRTRGIWGVSGATLIALAIVAAAQSRVWKDSRSLFGHAVAVSPSPSYVAYNNLGNAYRLTQQYEEAIENFTISLAIKPHPRTYANLGATYRKLGRFTEALKAYDDALALDPRNGVAQFGVGVVYAAMGREADAIDAYNKALVLDPDSEEVYTNIGALHANAGRLEEAVAAYRHAIELNPRLADAHYNLAVTLSDMGEYEEAILSYERAIDLRPASISPRINLGLLYARANRRDDAIDQFRAILRIDPSNKAALSALQQLGVTR